MQKIENLKDFEIYGDLELISGLILKARRKQENETNIKLTDSIARLFFYYHETRNNIRLYEKAISDYKLQRNRAILRAQKAEKSNEELKKSIENLKKFTSSK